MKNIFIILCIMIFAGCTRIDVGHVGIKINLASSDRGVEKNPTVTGWTFYNPLTQDVIEYPVNVQSLTWAKNKELDESITFSSSEGLIINADVGFAYNVNGNKAPELYSRFRQEDLDVLAHGYIRNIIRDSLNEVASTMPVQDIYGVKKSELLIKAKEHAKKILEPDGIMVDQLTFAGSLRLPQNVERAINMAIEQTQAAISAENKIQQVKAEAEQQVVRAKGEAEAILTKAKAESEANDLITKSLSPQLVQYKTMSKWNGILPQVTGNAVPMIDIGSIVQK